MGLTEKISALSPEMQEEVANFVEYLHQKKTQQARSAKQSIDAVRELKGLGKGLWKDIDPDQYIQNLRDEW